VSPPPDRPVPPEVRAAFALARAAHPEIGAAGYTTVVAAKAEPVGVREFARCLAYLRGRYVAAPHLPAARARGSYGLRQEIEQAVGGHVSSGAVLLAAKAAGFRIERTAPDSPNGWVFAEPMPGGPAPPA
jgi:hypothetical protein